MAPSEAHENIRPFTPAGDSRDFTYYLVLAGCGLRPGEACGLQLPDFDPVTGALRGTRAIGKGRRVKLTKTRTRRTVDVAAGHKRSRR